MIDLVFNILNLLVFVSLFVYGFYKYLLPSLKDSFGVYEQNINDLVNKKDELIVAQQDISNKIIEQEKLCIFLKGKIDVWKQSRENLTFQKKSNYLEFKNKLFEKLNKQSQNYQYDQLKKNITPALIESLTENLKKQFEKEENIELYFSNIFKEFK